MSRETREIDVCKSFKIDSPELLLSMLASSTWHPGRARPPLSVAREAYLRTRDNSFVSNLAFMASGLGFGYIFSYRFTIGNLTLAIGTGVVAGVLIFFLFFVGIFFKEFFLKKE